MQNVLWIGIGGFIGSILRYGLVSLGGGWKHSSGLAFGTLLVNVVGCLVIGLLSEFFQDMGSLSAQSRAFAFTGLLGGFTTYSAFSNETFDLWRNGNFWHALANVALHLILGLGAVWLGRYIALRLAA